MHVSSEFTDKNVEVPSENSGGSVEKHISHSEEEICNFLRKDCEESYNPIAGHRDGLSGDWMGTECELDGSEEEVEDRP